jgi:N-acetylmuramoyl-L-alanine amidase
MRGTGLSKRIMVSPNVEARPFDKRVDMIVLHYTGMGDAERACDWLCNSESKVSCHYLIDLDGNITQMVDENLRAWHAGVSCWAGDIDVNSRSIGIEIQNPGHSTGYPDFPMRQLQTVAQLSFDVVKRHEIPSRRVLAHSDVAPGRKIDPGEKFDWSFLAGHGVGHWLEPASLRDGLTLTPGDQGSAVLSLQETLRNYGYNIECNGNFDNKTKAVVSAFQRHFRPVKVDGVADQSTLETLAAIAN